MANAPIDDNRDNAQIAVDTDGDIATLLVDATTGRLLIDITATTSTTPVLNTSKIDENFKSTDLAYNGTDPKPLLIDNRNGLLWCDVSVE